ncbi:MAG TPA: CDP-alcohol phosphatidyltransferase family protein [Candidatus Tectomicrobia bacterium]|jgi:phosphatidylglycerophosphate synthase
MQASTKKGLLLLPGSEGSVEVARVPLLHRILLSGYKAGIQEWLVVAWHDAHRVRTSLEHNARLAGIAWQVFDLEYANATSLVRALPREELIVVAGTAVFDHRVLLELQQAEGTVLGVVTPEATATEITAEGVALCEQQSILGPATTPPAYRATGLLRCHGKLLGRVMLEAWDTVQRAPNPLWALLLGLLGSTKVKALDVSQHLWVPLTVPLEASVATAEAQLLRSLGREGDSFIVRVFDRRISQALTKRLVRTRVRPNQLTVFSALLGLSGACLLAQPSRLMQVLGSLLFLTSTIIDGCDGELARLTFQESDFGAKLDLIMDNVVHICLFSGIALGLYWEAHNTLYLWLGGLTLGGTLGSMAMYLPHVWHPPNHRSTLMRLHESLASRDFAYALPLLALFDKLAWFLWTAALGTYVFAATLGVLSLFRRWQDTQGLSRQDKTSP